MRFNLFKNRYLCFFNKNIVVILFITSLSFSMEGLHVYGETLASYKNIRIDQEKKQKTVLLNTKDTIKIVNKLLSRIEHYKGKLDFKLAFEKAGEAVFISEEFNSNLLKAKSHSEFGKLNLIFREKESTEFHLQQSLKYYKKAYLNKEIPSSALFIPYKNLLYFSFKFKSDEITKRYLDTCSAIIDTTKIHKINRVYIDHKKAGLLSKRNELEKSFVVFNKLKTTLESIPSDSTHLAIHKSLLLNVYFSIANLEVSKNNYDLALKYYQKSIDYGEINKSQKVHLSYVYLKYSELLHQLGKHELAYQTIIKSNKINDTYLNPRKLRNKGFINIKNSYEEQLFKKNKELEDKSLKLIQSDKKIFRFRIILFVIALVVIVFIFVLINRIQRFKHFKETELNKKKEENSKKILELKNKEITSNVLQLIEKEEIIKSIINQIKKTENNKSTLALINSIQKRSINLWDEFNSRFMSQNKDFYDKLKKGTPNLSAADLKICALIKLNFSSKEMAYLLGISVGSVHVSRHRLRKKMNLERDENLTTFINNI